MKATGIVVEYNPFHNGHLFHVNEARRLTDADVLIAVMSGNFLQRGEPAAADKWVRTEMALAAGVDLVIELPYAFATAHAPQFAFGAVSLLSALNCAYYCFGSEQGNIEPFENTVRLLHDFASGYENTVRQAVKEGISYPAALRKGYAAIAQKTDLPLADLSEPNNILGFQYMQAASRIQSSMQAVTIQRTGAGYHDSELPAHTIASATAIRRQLSAGGPLQDVRSFMPESSFRLLETERTIQNWEQFYPLLRYTILRDGTERLALAADVTEGIENALYQAAKEQQTFHSFMMAVKSKRYTWTRIQRMLVHILTGFRQEDRQQMTAPSYIRLLGMSASGRQYLRTVKKDLPLPLVSRAAAESDPSLQLDIKSTDIYMLASGQTEKIGADFRRPPIIV